MVIMPELSPRQFSTLDLYCVSKEMPLGIIVTEIVSETRLLQLPWLIVAAYKRTEVWKIY